MENLIYKIFIFESNKGNLIRTEDYDNLIEIQKEIIEYNKNNLNNRLNIYFGTDFPPKGVKYNLEIKQFINKTLSEQYEDGEIQIPPDFKIVDNVLVRLTKKELYDKGLLKLEYDEKIDELDNVVKLSKKEMYDFGKITKYQVYEYFIQELNTKIEDKLKKYYNYPMQEMGTWELKKNQSTEWLNLSVENKLKIINNSSIIKFDLIVSESGITSSDNETIRLEKIDLLSNKVVTKFKELETIYGNMFALRSNTKKELEGILLLQNINSYEEMYKLIKSLDI
jgi:hypothetical protein